VLDTIYEQRAFAELYLQALVERTGTLFKNVDAVVSRQEISDRRKMQRLMCDTLQSELTAQLLALPLTLLKHRFPHLFPHPPLLAHTVYQTVVFDESIKRGGLVSSRTWKGIRRRGSGGEESTGEWQGLTEEILNTDDWFERWWQGEKECEQGRSGIFSFCLPAEFNLTISRFGAIRGNNKLFRRLDTGRSERRIE
jgi:hypothetical protein